MHHFDIKYPKFFLEEAQPKTTFYHSVMDLTRAPQNFNLTLFVFHSNITLMFRQS